MMDAKLVIKSTLISVAVSAIAPAFSQSTSTASLPVFNVASYGASGAQGISYCSGAAGTNVMIGCTEATPDFSPGQGFFVPGGGKPSETTAITTSPIVTQQGNGTTGSHTYCYVVDTVDPLDAISAPSPQTCVDNEPALSTTTVYNMLSTTTSNVGPSPIFLWYVSQDGGPWQLVNIGSYTSNAVDVGERPGGRGGWPNNLPVGNPNIAKNEDFFSTIVSINGNQATIADTLPATFQNLGCLHDDTLAVQSAINAAVAAGGGVVQFGNGKYNIARPTFVTVGTLAYPVYTPSIAGVYWYEPYSYLSIPNGATGKIHIQGNGANTTLVTPPDHGTVAQLMFAGYFKRPNATTNVLKMNEVVKGATQVTLTTSPAAAGLTVGSDIFLYTGTFNGQPCADTNGTAGECHFSELNTVAAVNGNVLTLAYPASKHYYSDGVNSFGLVPMPVTPHDIALQNMTIDTYSPILSTGMVYSLLINNVNIVGAINHGPFGGGLKRDVTIENSSWTFGAGDASFDNTDEYDQFTNVSFLGNTITGLAAPGAEGVSYQARIYGTEGSSQFTVKNNTFNNVSLYFDETSDDVISNNQFTNGVVYMGSAFGNNRFLSGPNRNAAFVSYDSQAAADIDTNTFTLTAPFSPATVVSVGDFTAATVTNNKVSFSGNRSMFPVITAYSGTYTGNTLAVANSGGTLGFAVVPDQNTNGITSSFNIANNTIQAVGSIAAGVYITDPGFTDTRPICVQSNNYLIQLGFPTYVVNSGDINQTCQ